MLLQITVRKYENTSNSNRTDIFCSSKIGILVTQALIILPTSEAVEVEASQPLDRVRRQTWVESLIIEPLKSWLVPPSSSSSPGRRRKEGNQQQQPIITRRRLDNTNRYPSLRRRPSLDLDFSGSTDFEYGNGADNNGPYFRANPKTKPATSASHSADACICRCDCCDCCPCSPGDDLHFVE